MGKNYAVSLAAALAAGDWLLFTDADTVFGPRALSSSMRLALARRLDLLSGLPGMDVVGFWERISVPMLGLQSVDGGCLVRQTKYDDHAQYTFLTSSIVP